MSATSGRHHEVIGENAAFTNSQRVAVASSLIRTMTAHQAPIWKPGDQAPRPPPKGDITAMPWIPEPAKPLVFISESPLSYHHAHLGNVSIALATEIGEKERRRGGEMMRQADVRRQRCRRCDEQSAPWNDGADRGRRVQVGQEGGPG